MLKSNLLFLLPMFLCLSACSQQQPKVTTQQPTKAETPAEPVMTGGDKDEHGCIGSAGYQWSGIKNECIRLFEAGIRLDPKAKDLDKTLSAFVVFKSDTDDAQAEIHLPNVKNAVLLTKEKKESAGTWKNANYVLTQWKGMYSLSDNKKTLLYEGAAAK